MSEDRRHEGLTIWLTGLPCSGKTTIAKGLGEELRAAGRLVEILDGDQVRTNLSQGLGYSKQDRDTNVRRIAYVAGLLTRNGVFVIVAAVSPYRDARAEARCVIGNFFEVFVNCPLAVLIQRDDKGMYRKAMDGDISNFTGISDPYEAPDDPDLTVRTDRETPQESCANIVAKLKELGFPIQPQP